MPLLLIVLLFCMPSLAREAQPADDAFSTNYDEVLRDLVRCLDKDERTAADAASKLASLGKRSVPVLSDIIGSKSAAEKESDKQAVHYAILALAKIKSPDAGKVLAPILTNPKSNPLYRLIAVDGVGLETCDEGIAALQKVAGGDPDAALRKKALSQLSLIPQSWTKSEKLFVDALSDPDDEIRTLSAKLCYWAPIFTTATDRLIEIAEKDSCEMARANALMAIMRTRPAKSVPALVRICAAEQTSASLQKQALRTLVTISGIPFKDAAAVASWWTKTGEAQFAKLETPKETKEEK